jgi:hypothetical protein
VLCALWLAAAVAAPALSAPPVNPRPEGEATARSSASLAPLPRPPQVGLAPPKAEAVDRLNNLLSRLVSPDDEVRDAARREVLEVDATMVSAIARRLDAVADEADRGAMKKLLSEIRSDARNRVREQMRAEGKKGKVETPDYLDMLANHPRPELRAWRDLIAVAAMSRMLVQVGSVEAARELVNVYVRFGEFLRVDTQLQLEKMDSKAIAALIETRRHPAEKIARWAERQLDRMGMAIAGETVQVADPEALADILRAYGRVKDPDAARIVISFANSERAQIRTAARQSVALMGEVANWQLRDTYETIVGTKPPRDWSWSRTARELFGQFDRLRLAGVYQLFDQGMQAYQSGDLARMRVLFNRLLAQSPLFERRAEMAAGYLAFARQAPADQRREAIDALRRAERIGADQQEKQLVQSLLLTLEGEELLAQDVVDQVLFQRALELDPANARARDALQTVELGQLEKQSLVYRYAAAAAIGLVALLAIAVITLRRGRVAAENGASTGRQAENDQPQAQPAAQASDDAHSSDAGPPETKVD